MRDTKPEYLEAVKLLLELNDEDNDGLLLLLIEDTINAVLSYCRIDVLPRQLEGLIPRIAAAEYKRGVSDGIRTISEGERRVEYSDSSSVLSGYYERLKPFVIRAVCLPSEVESDENESV